MARTRWWIVTLSSKTATTYINFFLAKPSSGCFLTYCAVKSTLTLGGFLQQRLDKVLPGVVASEGQTKNAVLLEGSDVKSPPDIDVWQVPPPLY